MCFFFLRGFFPDFLADFRWTGFFNPETQPNLGTVTWLFSSKPSQVQRSFPRYSKDLLVLGSILRVVLPPGFGVYIILNPDNIRFPKLFVEKNILSRYPPPWSPLPPPRRQNGRGVAGQLFPVCWWPSW